jgi:phage/plasmid-like protein (TIGR03299 family)
MAHELYINVRGKTSMAYVNDEPWHGLGQKLTPDASIETWMQEAGMDYTILEAPALFNTPSGVQTVQNRNVLYRSDTHAPLGFVGSRYRVVQPSEVLEFFRDITESQQFELETAGVLFDGAKYWALARTGKTARIGGKNSKDVIDGYLLLATSCDGTLQTLAQFTSIRVVCNNTLTAATYGRDRKDNGAIKVSHRSIFNPDEVKKQLGIDNTWSEFVDGANELSKVRVKDEDALRFVVSLVGDPAKDLSEQSDKAKAVATVYQLYKGKGRGSDLKSAEGTAWGLVNGVSEYVDHLAGQSQDNRLYLGMFYDGSYLKNQAFQQAMKQFVYAQAA